MLVNSVSSDSHDHKKIGKMHDCSNDDEIERWWSEVCSQSYDADR